MVRLGILKTAAFVSLSCRSCFCLGNGHQLPAGHRAGGRCLEPCGDDRQTAGEPRGSVCVQRGPAYSLTSQGQGTELMKPLRSWLLAPPSSLLEHGSRDDYRLQQASPRPKYFVISCLFSVHRTESLSSFSSCFLESSCYYRMKGGIEEGSGLCWTLAHPRTM